MVREVSGAQAVCVIVVNGSRGSGFAQQIAASSQAEVVAHVQAVIHSLRCAASIMENDLKSLAPAVKA